MNDCTGDDGKLFTQRRKIAIHYLKGWFLFDLISSLPYEQLLNLDKWGVPSALAFLKVKPSLQPF